MSTSDRHLKLRKYKPVIRRIEQMHPHKMLTYLMIVGSSLIYLFFVISFFQFSNFDFVLPGPDHFPKLFIISTVMLTASLVFSTRIREAYRQDRIKQLRILLSSMLIVGLLFMITQALAWFELLAEDFPLRLQKFQSYLFLFSGVHLVHVAAGVVMVGFQFYRISSIEGDPVKCIVLLTNPYEKIKLEIITMFWHYILLTWMLIFTLFLVVY
jgi:cytochrome c oxidase subunit 3